MFVSAAAHWEIAIKISTGKYSLTLSFSDFVQQSVFDNGFQIVAIEPVHSDQLATLPFHHRDPFDRMMIAQCMVESLSIVSADGALDAYPVRRIW